MQKEKTVEKLLAENRELRELLWARHGCRFPALYGDDGERQCSECRIDFMRDEPALIEQRFHEIGLRKLRHYAKTDSTK